MRSDLALAALASAAVPGMKPVSVAGMSSADPDVDREVQRALVQDATGRRWVVHAPLTPVAGARMQRNDELARQLSRHVPFKVPTPAGYATVGTEGVAAVYPHVEGTPLDLSRLPAGQGLASAVGRAVAAIHNIPRAVFEEQDVPAFDAAGCRQRATAEVDRAAETGRVPTGLLARWEEAFDAPALWQFATTPVHGAFGGDTVLVTFTDDSDAASGRVVAVLDWREAMVADPAVDLAALYAQTSQQAWESVLDSYTLGRTHRPDPYLHARARLLAETRVLGGLAGAVADGREHEVRKIVEALRRMDRLTEDDDSLVPVTARPRATAPATGTEPPAAPFSSAVVGRQDVEATPEHAAAGVEPWQDATQDGDDRTQGVPTRVTTDHPGVEQPADEADDELLPPPASGDGPGSTAGADPTVDVPRPPSPRAASALAGPGATDGPGDRPDPATSSPQEASGTPGPPDDGSWSGSGGTTSGSARADHPVRAPDQVERSPAPEHDESPGWSGGSTDVPADAPSADGDDSDGSRTGGDTVGPDEVGEHAAGQHEAGEGKAGGDEAGGDEAGEDDLDAETRLHELYGMPEPDVRQTPPRPSGRDA